MEIDPVDFFPGCEPYYITNTRRSSSSCCRNVCTHVLVMILSFGICIATIYYYENYYKALGYINNSFTEDQTIYKETKNIDYILAEMEKINYSLTQMSLWRREMEMLVLKKYSEQDRDIEKKMQNAIDVYDCDKIGMYDYASVYAGGSIVSTPHTQSYPANKTISFFKLLDINLLSNPEAILQPSNLPGNCFAFYGSTGRIRIKLAKAIRIQSVTMEHSLYTDDCSSAPKDFRVHGLLDPFESNGVLMGRFSYSLTGRPYQTFHINNYMSYNPYQYVELEILNNHGKDFTCVYRFRVHSTSNRKCRCEY